jgi:transcriptional regulator with XRE-family HTH domain
MAIGDVLIRLRDRKGIKQYELAEYLEVSQNTISDWESNKTDIKSKYIPKIADFFGVEISDLFSSDSKIIIKQINKENSKNNYNAYNIKVSEKSTIENLNSNIEKLIALLEKKDL